MKILVTGVAGYLGTELAKLLTGENHSVFGVDSLLYGNHALERLRNVPQLSFLPMEVSSLKSRHLEGVNAIVHLAALVGEQVCNEKPELAIRYNFESTQRLYDMAESAGVERFVFASTCSNYGVMPEANQLLDEDTPLNPLSLYANTKVQSEAYLLSRFAGAAGISPTILRFATLFGISTRMRFDLTVNHFTRDLFFQKELEIFAGDTWRPYLHVRDAARAIDRVLTAPKEKVDRQIFNVGNSSLNFSKQDIAAAIQKQIPFPTTVNVREGVEKDRRNYRVSFRRIAERLDFSTRETVDSGISEIISRFVQNAFSDPYDPKYHNSLLRNMSLR